MEPLTKEQIEEGWVENERGGVQPPEHLIDFSEIPKVTSFVGWKPGGARAMYQDMLRRREGK
jgi:hypothetical protein